MNFAGLPVGTVFQALMVALLALISAVLVARMRYGPDQLRAETEGDASLRAALMARVNKLEADQLEDRVRHAEERKEDREECDRVTSELRGRIREQDKLIDGLQRQLIMFQVASGRVLPLDAKSPEIESMLATLSAVLKGKDTEDSDLLAAAKETEIAAITTVEMIEQDEAAGRL